MAKLRVHHSCLPQGKRFVAEFNSFVLPEKLPFSYLVLVLLVLFTKTSLYGVLVLTKGGHGTSSIELQNLVTII